MDDLAQQVADKARRAVEQLRDYATEELDYSGTSLSAVEKMLAEAAPFATDMPDHQIDALVRIVGSYVLEVGRRELGGKYYWHEDHDQPILVVGEPDRKISLMTFDMVRGRLIGDQDDSIPYFYQGFATRARTAEPGSDELFA